TQALKEPPRIASAPSRNRAEDPNIRRSHLYWTQDRCWQGSVRDSPTGRKGALHRLLRNTRLAKRTMRRCPRESEGIFHGLRRGRSARSAYAVSDDAR